MVTAKFSRLRTKWASKIFGPEYIQQVEKFHRDKRYSDVKKQFEQFKPYNPPPDPRKNNDNDNNEPLVSVWGPADYAYEDEKPVKKKKNSPNPVKKMKKTAAEYHDDGSHGKFADYEEFSHYYDPAKNLTKQCPYIEDVSDLIKFIMRYVPLYGSQMATAGVFTASEFDKSAYEYMLPINHIVKWVRKYNPHFTDDDITHCLKTVLRTLKAYVISNYGGHTNEPFGFETVDDHVIYKPYLRHLQDDKYHSAEYYHKRWETQAYDQYHRNMVLQNAYKNIPKKPPVRLAYAIPKKWEFDQDKKKNQGILSVQLGKFQKKKKLV